VRHKREHVDNRSVTFWSAGDGLGGMSATMLLGHTDALEARLDTLAAGVCDQDPRTLEQRRADALGALGAGHDQLSRQCGAEGCPAGGQLPSPAQVTIHLVAELAREARLRPLIHPADAPPEPRYTPSGKLAEFVRARDLTCRAPGCDRPAVDCDMDHTTPHRDGGATHASNLKCLCYRASSSDRHAGEHVERGEQGGGGVSGYHHLSGPSRRHFCRSASAARTAASLTR
jgi:hypothetical protein